MKKLFSLTVFLCAFTMNAQTLGYNDLGVLFTGEDYYGTARFRGMSGAFGALGGDISAIDINPAGAAIFLKSEFSFSINVRDQTINSDYYGTNTSVNDTYTTLSQMGAVFVFKNRASKWGNTAIGFNYSQSRNFNNFWAARGNSNYPTFIYDEDYTDDGDDSNDNLYLNTDGQLFENYTSGKNNRYTFSFASQYEDKIAVGATLNTHSLRFYQYIYLEESNYDDDGNYLPVYLSSLSEELWNYGYGFSFNLGIIAKPVENFRVGIAYQSPVWYNFTEEFYDNEGYLNGLYYSMRTPGKYTGSAAYIFGKLGLISIDYSFKDYRNIKLDPSYDFSDINNNFKTELRGTSEVRIGTEWRYKKTSFRAGYNYQQNPYKDALSSDNLNGYSLGIGYSFGFMKFDFAYEHSKRNDFYDFYPQYDEVEPAELDFDASKFTFTLVFNI